jgi:hypothetical protein
VRFKQVPRYLVRQRVFDFIGGCLSSETHKMAHGPTFCARPG